MKDTATSEVTATRPNSYYYVRWIKHTAKRLRSNMGLFIKTSIIFVPFTRSVEKHDKTLPLLDVADSASGNTPLMYATMANKINLLESMISFGSQINVANKVKYGILLTTYLKCRFCNKSFRKDETLTS